MRHTLIFAAALAAQPVLAQNAPPPIPDTHFDVTQDHGPQHVTVLKRTFPVGGSAGWHTHPGVEIATLIAGEMELAMAGQPVRRLNPGDSFMVQRGIVHNATNVGTAPAQLLITYVTDSGEQVKVPAQAPAAR
jgi:quercetin dioxygenase-like cupin family protein